MKYVDRPDSWSTRTAADVQMIAEAEGSIAVLPVGSTEQHGRHLPVGTDTILAKEIAELGAERVRNDIPLLVIPPIWHGYSPHHTSFGGTITAEFETLRRLLEDVATSVLECGFDALLLLNGHGGNAPLVSAASSTIGVEHPDATVLSVTYFALAAPFVDELRESELGGMSHGGEFETALMLHLHPDLVRSEELEASPLDEPYDHALDDMMEGGPLSLYRPFEEYTDSGAIGEPDVATAETGAAIYEAIGDELEAMLGQIHEQPRPKPE